MTDFDSVTMHDFEVQILSEKGKVKSTLVEAREFIDEHLSQLDYILSRFLEDFGSYLDPDNELPAEKVSTYKGVHERLTRDYSIGSRFSRFLEHYEQ